MFRFLRWHQRVVYPKYSASLCLLCVLRLKGYVVSAMFHHYPQEHDGRTQTHYRVGTKKRPKLRKSMWMGNWTARCIVFYSIPVRQEAVVISDSYNRDAQSVGQKSSQGYSRRQAKILLPYSASKLADCQTKLYAHTNVSAECGKGSLIGMDLLKDYPVTFSLTKSSSAGFGRYEPRGYPFEPLFLDQKFILMWKCFNLGCSSKLYGIPAQASRLWI